MQEFRLVKQTHLLGVVTFFKKFAVTESLASIQYILVSLSSVF